MAKPWQTLLFCPNSASAVGTLDATSVPHPGVVSPPNHTYADLLAAGKINLNYQLEPFHHVTRATGMYALLKSMRITAMSDDLSYKLDSTAASPATFYKTLSLPTRATIATTLLDTPAFRQRHHDHSHAKQRRRASSAAGPSWATDTPPAQPPALPLEPSPQSPPPSLP